jgi:hypothetical protein
MIYRRFSVAVQIGVLGRATDSSGRVHCDRCGIWVKSRAEYEIDHVIPEGMRPEADKQKPLTMADGQLLCRANCHRAEKTPEDVAQIAQAKRREAYHKGIKRPGKASQERLPKRLTKRAAGPPRIAREYGL